MRMRLFGVCFIVVLLFITSTAAQSPNGTVSGIVLDPSGGVIAGADIIIVNDATGLQYSGKTNSEGIYVVPNLPPGAYRIQVSKIGFKTLIKPDIILNVQDALAINFTLPLGAVMETVTIVGGAPLVNTQSAAVSTVIDRQFVENLPLNGRSFNTLLQLTPGIVIAPATATSPGQFSIAGQRTNANNFLVDGVSANFGVASGHNLGESGTGSAQAFSALGGSSSLVSVDALQEFRIETSSFAAEFGRVPGGQVILTTRSGTNDFHGGVFDYFRNTVMDANDWFANKADNPRAPEHHNDFGGFLGGPIWKGKTFFFFSYEGARLDQPQTTSIQVPSEYARTNAPTQLGPYLNGYPQPDDRRIIPGVYTSRFTGTYSNGATLDATGARIDHAFNSRFSIFGRYNDAPSKTVGRCCALNDLLNTKVDTQTLTLGANIFISSRFSNTLRGNYSKQGVASFYTIDSFGGAVPANTGLLLGSLAADKNQGSFFAFDTQAYYVGPEATNETRQVNLANDLAISEGRHGLKFGGDYRAIFLDTTPYQHYIGLLATSVENFTSTGSFSFISSGSEAPSQFLIQSLSLYGQDTWKITSKLTLNYGLRWELSPAPSSRGKTTLASWKNVNDPQEIVMAPVGTSLWNTQYDNFGPRIGVAYRLGSAGLVLRAGFGVYYDLGGASSSSQLASAFPNLVTAFYVGAPAPISDATQYLPILSSQPPYRGTVQGFSPDLQLPRSYQWNVALEKSFDGEQAISATYVGQAGRNLLRQEAFYQPNANFSGDFQLTLNSSQSNYNALQLQYRRPISGHLQALLNYTWSHSLDNTSSDVVTALPKIVLSGANDYGASSYDVRHSFSGAVTYNPPVVRKYGQPLTALTKDWSFDIVVVARAGFPFNGIVVSATPDPGGYAYSRPDLVPGQAIWIHDPNAPGGQRLNPGAFSVPSIARQGTEPRNDIPGFGLTQMDLSVGRKFFFTERVLLQFRADAFNLLNHPNFTNPQAYVEFGPAYLQSQQMLNAGLGGLNALFQEGGPRSIQLSLKLAF